MTTIRRLSEPGDGSAVRTRRRWGAVLDGVSKGFLVAAVLFVTVLHVQYILRERDRISEFFGRELEGAVRAMHAADMRCGLDGGLGNSASDNCYDYRGFRVVIPGPLAPVRVFSLRYEKPLFIFSIRNGMTAFNQQVPSLIAATERDAFIRYVSGQD